ncbi:hypothetical protein A2U01_0085768, partial [Trifolium medium]|nr:hypothetical protein [Trifolium medium]
ASVMVKQDRSGSVSSGASVNKDWEHWVVLHGNEKVVTEDVREMGQIIGVNFNGASMNMFDALSRGERVKEVECHGGGRGSRGDG